MTEYEKAKKRAIDAGVLKFVAEDCIRITKPLPSICTLLDGGVIIDIEDIRDIVEFLFPGYEVKEKAGDKNTEI